jgi:hypothetical protein
MKRDIHKLVKILQADPALGINEDKEAIVIRTLEYFSKLTEPTTEKSSGYVKCSGVNSVHDIDECTMGSQSFVKHPESKDRDNLSTPLNAEEFVDEYPLWVRTIIHDGDTKELAEFIDRYASRKQGECERCKQLEFMIDNGLGWKDIENDIQLPHEI